MQGSIASMVFGCAFWLIASAATAAEENADDLRSLVSSIEDGFLEELESAKDLNAVFDKYESRLRQLIAQNPGRPEPYVGFCELFEKCETGRSLALIREFMATPGLPENVRTIYAGLQKTLILVGTDAVLAFENLNGGTTDLRSYRGKVVLVDFWATWCGPCVSEIPKLQAYRRELRSQGLEIVGVSFDDDEAKLRAFVTARELPWEQIHAIGERRERIASTLGVTRGYLPTVFLIGRDGRIRHTLNSRFRLQEKIRTLLAER